MPTARAPDRILLKLHRLAKLPSQRQLHSELQPESLRPPVTTSRLCGWQGLGLGMGFSVEFLFGNVYICLSCLGLGIHFDTLGLLNADANGMMQRWKRVHCQSPLALLALLA